MKIEFKNHNDFPLVWPETMRGVLEMLDKYFPSITDGIDLDNFNMTKANICIFGQTIGWRNRCLMFDFRTRCNNNYYSIANQTEEWTHAIIEYRESKMKNGKFEIGDVVERISDYYEGMEVGDRSVVTGRVGGGALNLKDYRGGHDPDNLKLVATVFNLRIHPWFIRTETPKQRIAAQEWLFEQGVEWGSSGQTIATYDFAFLTNTMTNGVVCKGIMCGRDPNDVHHSAQEIKLTYKTTVTDVVYPDVESDRDKEIKAIRKEQEVLAARLKALEVGS